MPFNTRHTHARTLAHNTHMHTHTQMEHIIVHQNLGNIRNMPCTQNSIRQQLETPNTKFNLFIQEKLIDIEKSIVYYRHTLSSLLSRRRIPGDHSKLLQYMYELPVAIFTLVVKVETSLTKN